MTASAEPPTSLPPECYRSATYFERESECALRAGWLAVAHLSEIPAPGDYLCHDLLGESLVVTRDERGAIHVLSRVCLHRWALVAVGSGRAHSFRCPFHGWTYALDGRLLGAPVTGSVAGFDARNCRLPRFPQALVDGFVLVNLDGEATAPPPALGERFPLHRLDTLRVAGRLHYEARCNWKLLVEAFMESYHHVGTHEKTLEPLFPARGSFAEPASAHYALLHTPARSDATDANDTLPDFEGLNEDERDRFFVCNVFPCHLVALAHDAVFWFRVTPLAAERSTLDCVLLLPPAVLQLADAKKRIREVMDWADVINREDMAINEAQQRGLASRRATAGVLNPLEAANAQFADWIRRNVGEPGPD